MIILITVGAHDGVTERTLYLASDDYTSRPTDNPPNQYFTPRIKHAGLFEQHMFSSGDGLSGGTTRGRSTVGAGDIIALSAKPYGWPETLDVWLTYAFEGRPVTIRSVESASQALSDATMMFTGVVDQVVSTDVLNEFSIKIRDRLADLDKPLLTARYLGTTVASAATAEGNADQKEKLKPHIWGIQNNVECVPANVYDLIYQVSDGPVSSIAVYEAGLAHTFTADFSTIALLRAAVLVPGQYATAKALGLFRLGGSPSYGLTADVVEGATAANRTMAQIVRRMLLHFGIVEADLVLSTFTALDADNTAECGITVNSEETCLNAVSRVLASDIGWLIPNEFGLFMVGRLEEPSGDAVAAFDLDDQIGGAAPERLQIGDDNRGIPAYKVVVRYDRIGKVQAGADLVGAVTAVRRAYLGQAFRETSAQDVSILTRYPKAPVITVDSCFATLAAADIAAARILDLYATPREMYRMRFAAEDSATCVLAAEIELASRDGRIGLGSGKNFRIIGRVNDYGRDGDIPTNALEIWG